jgi:biotin carboxyl carrier protein
MNLTARKGDAVHEVRIERQAGQFLVVVDGVEHLVDAHKLDADFYSILIGTRSYEVSVEAAGTKYFVRHGSAEQVVHLTDPSREGRDELRRAGEGPEVITAIMPGKVVRVMVSEGDTIEPGHGLVVLEAMKMENEITAPRGGRVARVAVKPGQTVESGAELVVVE